jgi:D-psicose/D-tagatose/L-ribulose 3-epimerase
MNLTWAVHAYAWTSHWTNQDLAIIDRAQALGLDAVEIPLMDIDDVDPEAIEARARAHDVRLICSTVCGAQTDPCSADAEVRRAAVAYLSRCVEATAAMGAGVLSGVLYSHHGGRLSDRPSREHRQRSASVLREVAQHAAGHGVTLGLEPCNRYETYLVNTADQALELVELVGEDNIGVHLDSYHMNIEEDGFAQPIRAVGDRLVHFHLSESHRGVPGQGTVAWEAIVATLREIGYEGFVGLESFEEVAPSMRAATCVWREMAESSDALVEGGLRYLRSLAEAQP